MKNSVRISLLTVPALVVTGASLLILLVAVAGAASSGKQNDLGSLKGPALQSQFLIRNDASPNPAPVSAPQRSESKTSKAVEFSIPFINDNIKLKLNLGGVNSTQSGVILPPTNQDHKGIKAETEKETSKEKETEKETEKEKESESGKGGTSGSDD